MRFKLTAKENRDTGEIGWQDSRIRGELYGSSHYAIGLAHDLLEHESLETIEDEIMAHGAMYFIRYEGGWCNSFSGETLSMENFAREWITLFESAQREDYFPTIPKTLPLDECIEEDISSIIMQGRVMIREEFSHLFEPGEDDNEENTLENLSAEFRSHFRQGYRNARRRYKGLRADQVCSMFYTLTDAFKRQRIDVEGQEIAVTVNLKTCRVSIDEIRSEEYA